MSALEPLRPDIVPSRSKADRQVANAVRRIDGHTKAGIAAVRSDAVVTAEALRELDRLAEVAMLGQTMLTKVRDIMGTCDPFLQDELRMFSDIAKVGKAEMLADFVDRVRRR